jgi:hypothetical protein
MSLQHMRALFVPRTAHSAGTKRKGRPGRQEFLIQPAHDVAMPQPTTHFEREVQQVHQVSAWLLQGQADREFQALDVSRTAQRSSFKYARKYSRALNWPSFKADKGESENSSGRRASLVQRSFTKSRKRNQIRLVVSVALWASVSVVAFVVPLLVEYCLSKYFDERCGQPSKVSPSKRTTRASPHQNDSRA